MNKVGDIHSPTIHKSISLSLSTSLHNAEVTNPIELKPGAIESVISFQPFISFLRSIDFGIKGYFPGIALAPINISISPSLS